MAAASPSGTPTSSPPALNASGVRQQPRIAVYVNGDQRSQKQITDTNEGKHEIIS